MIDSHSTPLFSVMIPTYRPEKRYLRSALESVLQQANDSEGMHIEVVDDCSPDVDVEDMVKSMAGSRVSFYRNPKNLGLGGCWNTCINRANGSWIHILHQDDYVLPGFYTKIRHTIHANKGLALVATRSLVVDEDNIIVSITPRYRTLENQTKSIEVFMKGNPIQCPGVVVNRNFYHQSGGFREELLFALDYEMWMRAFAQGSGIILPDALSCFRQSSASSTPRLHRSGDSIRDADRLIAIFRQDYPEYDCEYAYRWHYEIIFNRARQFSKKNDTEAALANWKYWRQNVPFFMKIRVISRWATCSTLERLRHFIALK